MVVKEGLTMPRRLKMAEILVPLEVAKKGWDAQAQILSWKRGCYLKAKIEYEQALDANTKARDHYIRLCEQANGSLEEREDDE